MRSFSFYSSLLRNCFPKTSFPCAAYFGVQRFNGGAGMASLYGDDLEYGASPNPGENSGDESIDPVAGDDGSACRRGDGLAGLYRIAFLDWSGGKSSCRGDLFHLERSITLDYSLQYGNERAYSCDSLA